MAGFITGLKSVEEVEVGIFEVVVKPIYLLKKIFRPLCIRAPFRYSRKRQ